MLERGQECVGEESLAQRRKDAKFFRKALHNYAKNIRVFSKDKESERLSTSFLRAFAPLREIIFIRISSFNIASGFAIQRVMLAAARTLWVA